MLTVVVAQAAWACTRPGFAKPFLSFCQIDFGLEPFPCTPARTATCTHSGDSLGEAGAYFAGAQPLRLAAESCFCGSEPYYRLSTQFSARFNPRLNTRAKFHAEQ
jgi:hypothetical protein